MGGDEVHQCPHACTAVVSGARGDSQRPVQTKPQFAAFKRQLLRLRYRVRLMVETSSFNNVFLIAILANTIVLALEYDGMSPK